jgi:RNA polymerase sigma-70 factor (ECF subfamily)
LTEQNQNGTLELTEPAFEKFFKAYFKSLHSYAFVMLQDESMAEEMVQQVFYRIWIRKEQFRVHTSARAFLYQAVHNECLNYLKHQKHKLSHRNHLLHVNKHQIDDDNAGTRLELNELEAELQRAIGSLPEKCRNIFYLSRFEGLKYREIAAELGLSVKTVEAQMSKALKVLRKKLIHFLPILIGLLFNTK